MADSMMTGFNYSQRGLKLFAVTSFMAVTAALSLPALAQPGPHGGRGGDFGGPGMFMGSPERVDKGVDRMLDRVGNATDAQRAQIKVIVKAAAADLASQHATSKALREQGRAIFTAPTVDAASAESVRQQQLAQHDTASRRILQAMLDISRVLTPEQRQKIGEAMKMREDRMKDRAKDRPVS